MQGFTIPLSVICGVVIGFVLMWSVFGKNISSPKAFPPVFSESLSEVIARICKVVHEKYIRHRNIVSFATIFLLSIISAFTFTRGMAWMVRVLVGLTFP